MCAETQVYYQQTVRLGRHARRNQDSQHPTTQSQRQDQRKLTRPLSFVQQVGDIHGQFADLVELMKIGGKAGLAPLV